MAKHQAKPPTPQPDPRGVIPSPDEFEAWCQHPVTRFVATAWVRGAEIQREYWLSTSWNPEKPLSEVERAAFMARADAYRAFVETGLSDYYAILEISGA